MGPLLRLLRLLFVVAALAYLVLGGVSVSPDVNSIELHFSITNQSVVQETAHISVSVDGKPIFSEALPVRSQHFYRQFALRVSPGTHMLRIEESRTQTVEEASFDVGRETWIRIKFAHDRHSDKHRIIVDQASESIPTK